MTLKLYPEQNVQDIADAIRGKNGLSDTYKIGEMASAITAIPTGITPSGTISITSNASGIDVTQYASADVNVPTGGGGQDFDKLVMRTISVASGSVSYIGNNAFAQCSVLTTVSFPSATSIGIAAFQLCTNLTTASFPNVVRIDSDAFAYCSNLSIASFPNATSIGNSAFTNCSDLTTASFPNVTNIGANAFSKCGALTTTSFPSATSILGNAFASCSNLTTVNFPNATSIGSSAFASCPNLTTASFPNVTNIGAWAFYRCYNLLSLYLLGSSVATLQSANTFNSSPISDYTTSTGGVNGSIFVPSSLYNTYIAANNWSAYASRFVSV